MWKSGKNAIHKNLKRYSRSKRSKIKSQVVKDHLSSSRMEATQLCCAVWAIFLKGKLKWHFVFDELQVLFWRKQQASKEKQK